MMEAGGLANERQLFTAVPTSLVLSGETHYVYSDLSPRFPYTSAVNWVLSR